MYVKAFLWEILALWNFAEGEYEDHGHLEKEKGRRKECVLLARARQRQSTKMVPAGQQTPGCRPVS